VAAVGGDLDRIGNSGYDTFQCWSSGSDDNYAISIGNGGGFVDMTRLGQLTGYESETIGTEFINEHFLFGMDTVIVNHRANQVVQYDYVF
jgi:hypothetical protein